MSEQPALVSRAESGDPYDTPPLATCSYWEYQRGMGTATRITLYPPRGISLPDPRWTSYASWPSVQLLQPGRAYFRQGLPAAEFRDRYLADLNRPGYAQRIAAVLRQLPVEDGRIVLLCFEKTTDVTVGPMVCHRRIFAEWWQELTGREVPELTRSDPDASFFAPTFFDQPITP